MVGGGLPPATHFRERNGPELRQLKSCREIQRFAVNGKKLKRLCRNFLSWLIFYKQPEKCTERKKSDWKEFARIFSIYFYFGFEMNVMLVNKIIFIVLIVSIVLPNTDTNLP